MKVGFDSTFTTAAGSSSYDVQNHFATHLNRKLNGDIIRTVMTLTRPSLYARCQCEVEPVHLNYFKMADTNIEALFSSESEKNEEFMEQIRLHPVIYKNFPKNLMISQKKENVCSISVRLFQNFGSVCQKVLFAVLTQPDF